MRFNGSRESCSRRNNGSLRFPAFPLCSLWYACWTPPARTTKPSSQPSETHFRQLRPRNR
jgi:hypothetical protein